MVRSSDDLHAYVTNYTAGNLDAKSNEKTVMLADSFFDDSLDPKSIKSPGKVLVQENQVMTGSKGKEPSSLADSFDE